MKKRVLSLFIFLLFVKVAISQNASFTSSPAANNNVLSLCAGSQVLFTNTTAGVSSINWTFQGGVLHRAMLQDHTLYHLQILEPTRFL